MTKDKGGSVSVSRVLVVGFATVLPLAIASSARAAYYEVYTSSIAASSINAADGYCSLAEAVKSVNDGMAVSNCNDLDPGGSGHIQLIEAPGKSYASFHYVIGSLTISRSLRIQVSEEGFTAYIDGAGTQAFKINSGVNVDFYGLNIRHIGSGSGRLIYNSGSLNMSNVTIRNGNVTTEPQGLGGGIYNEKTLWMGDCQLLNNSAKRGGGLYNKAGSVTITSSTISGNSATMAGGGIYNVNSGAANPPTDIVVSSTTISSNSARSGGGMFNKGIIEMVDSSITGNTATTTGSSGETCGASLSCDGDGGGACSVAASSTTYARIGAEDSLITNNVAAGRGGGFYSAGQLNLVTVTISGNKANRGGAIFASSSGTNNYCSVSSPQDFTYSFIKNNTVTSGGLYGIIDWNATSVTAKCVMAQNRVQASGNSSPACAPNSTNPGCPQ